MLFANHSKEEVKPSARREEIFVLEEKRDTSVLRLLVQAAKWDLEFRNQSPPEEAVVLKFQVL
jgi:hypothetical protein